MPRPPSQVSARALVVTSVTMAVAAAVVLHRSAVGEVRPQTEAAVGLETAAGMVGLLLALLALGRFRQSGLFSDLALVHALAVLVFTNLFLSGLPALLGLSPLRAGAAPPPPHRGRGGGGRVGRAGGGSPPGGSPPPPGGGGGAKNPPPPPPHPKK
jgi:hypothetical protein